MNTIQEHIAESSATYASGDNATYARLVLESIPVQDKQRALFSEIPADKDGNIRYYFAGMIGTVRKVSGGYMCDPNESVTFDRNGRPKTWKSLTQEKTIESLAETLRAFSIRVRNHGLKCISERRNVYSDVARISQSQAQALVAQAEQDRIARELAEKELADLRAQVAKSKQTKSA